MAAAFDDAKRNERGIPRASYALSGTNATGMRLKGTMTKALWKTYIIEHFIKNLKPTDLERGALIIIDGHESHFDLEFLLACQNLGIDVVQEPSNCSSVLQALDQVCFQVLKQGWKQEMMNWQSSAHNKRKKFSRFDIPFYMGDAWDAAFCPANVKASFRRAGLCPLNVEVPLARLRTVGTYRHRYERTR